MGERQRKFAEVGFEPTHELRPHYLKGGASNCSASETEALIKQSTPASMQFGHLGLKTKAVSAG